MGAALLPFHTPPPLNPSIFSGKSKCQKPPSQSPQSTFPKSSPRTLLPKISLKRLVFLVSLVSCSPLCSTTFDLGKSSKLKCVLKGQKLSRLLVSKIDRTQTSFRALFGIKARKLKKTHIFQNSISICKALLWASQ